MRLRYPLSFGVSSLLLAFVVVGCKGDATAESATNTTANANLGLNEATNTAPANTAPTNAPVTNAPANDPSATTPPPTEGAVKITTVAPGKGVGANAGDLLAMKYVGKLTDGTVFDSNTSGAPFYLVVDSGEVIKGWDEGLKGIKVGERRTLNIPSAKGYGPTGSPPKIGPNADLVFDVECLEIIPKDKQDVVRRETLREGTGAAVKEGQTATFKFVGKFVDGSEFDRSEDGKSLAVKVGAGRVVAGLDYGLIGMKKGGKYRLTVPPLSAYGLQGSPDGKIPAKSILVFDVEMVGVK